MNWLDLWRQWVTVDQPRITDPATDRSARDLEEQRLLQDVWRRIERAGQGYLTDRALYEHPSLDDHS